MGDIFEFPSAQAQGLAYLDRQLRQILEARGADQQLMDFAAAELTKIYAELNASEQYSFSVDLPDGLVERERSALNHQITAGLEGVRKENHALMIRLVAQLVLTQMRLFQLERCQ